MDISYKVTEKGLCIFSFTARYGKGISLLGNCLETEKKRLLKSCKLVNSYLLDKKCIA